MSRRLREQARRFEQAEDWARALELYSRAMDEEEQEESSIALLNRVGDLQVRVGDLSGAVESYEQAIESYLAADLPNNALAVCRKLERNVPGRAGVRLMMGRIRAKQGFVVDAREDFVAYAEMQLSQGDPDEALRSLEEFASLAPDDVELLVLLAEQLQRSDETERAVARLHEARAVALRSGDEEQARQIGERLEELSDGSPAAAAIQAEGLERDRDEPPEAVSTVDDVNELESALDGGIAFESTTLGGDEVPEDLEPLPGLESTAEVVDAVSEAGVDDLPSGPSLDAIEPESELDDTPSFAALEGTVFTLDEEPADAGGGEEDAPDLEQAEDGGGPFELPLLASYDEAPDHGTEDDDSWRATAHPPNEAPPEQELSAPEEIDLIRAAGPDSDDQTPRTAEEWRALGVFFFREGRDAEARDALERAYSAFGSAGEPELAMRVVRELIFHEPDQIEHHQRLVEYAHETKDRTLIVPAYLELAELLVRSGASRKAEAVFGQVLALDPRNPRAREALARLADGDRPEPPGGGDANRTRDYVNLGGLVLEEGEAQSFRWKVPTLDPSGDEDADFARMLSQFKEKVSQNVPSDDAEAHYDLGSAYRDMGLLDEAIAEFQQAIRAHPRHVAAYEMLGKSFLDQGQPQMALRALGRVLQLDHSVEDELLGIYYYLGIANEEVGNPETAREFYERVFSLDINFRDVTERLRELR